MREKGKDKKGEEIESSEGVEIAVMRWI